MRNRKLAQASTVAPAGLGTSYADYAQLIKLRLSLMVVVSAVLAYLIVAGGGLQFTILTWLALGGFCITASANAINQILEKDFDKLMKRTASRPLPTGRMQTTQALLFAGLAFVLGILFLALINPLTAMLGALSAVLYAFLYTPLKRITTFSVFVGAIPGALPVLIGAVAFEGTFTTLALVLFAIQFFWQFPHFWAIGFLGFEDYQKAGYRLMPEKDGSVDPSIGLQSLIFTLFLFPCLLAPCVSMDIGLIPCLISLIWTVLYAILSWRFFRATDRITARNLMFFSFAYLPAVLITLYLGTV